MAGTNLVILLGNLGKDPDVRHLESGRTVAQFSLATSKTYKNKAGEKVTQTDWHNVVLWSPLAEIAEKYLKKGYMVQVIGEIRTRSYDKDGERRYITEVYGNQMNLLNNNKSDGSAESVSQEDAEALAGAAGSIDDLPF